MDRTVQLPGFRFHPTEEELLEFYLKKMACGKNAHCDIIGYLNIYLYDPWDLPGLSKIGEREWYFFVPRDRKHGSGGRPNRTTENGFWKATGSDRKIFGLSDPKKILGFKKTLVFYRGRAPRGNKTDWVMNEYRLPDTCSFAKEVVLCKIYRKATSMKVLEQRAAMEEEIKTPKLVPHPLSLEETNSFYTQSDDLAPPIYMASNDNEFHQDLLLFLDEKLKEETDPSTTSMQRVVTSNDNNMSSVNKAMSLRLPKEVQILHDLQLPKLNLDWTQDSFWTQLCSPWLENIMLTSPYANVLNF
ncbi:hypothetical protein SSX86_020987 [Deinandra increscens subsp. villosa]|uniref:NAC domain-containing protein n=1 Tax=Deinandra increscens subsp. villosa TaxID=3103831 RepID=A0AAP0GRA6_9ASTR